MPNIYQDAQGRSVYDSNGRTIDAKTGAVIGTAPLPNLSGVTPPTLPTPGTPTPTPTTPLPTQGQGTLSNLMDALNLATDLARQKRNKLLTQVVGTAFPKGTLRARDFGSILDAANTGSEKTVDLFTQQLKEPSLTGDIAQYNQAKQLGIIPDNMDYFAFIQKSSAATRAPSSNTQLTDTQINQGIVASGKTRQEFIKLPESEQLDYVFGAKKDLLSGRLPPEDLQATKDDIKTLMFPADTKKNKPYTRQQIEDLINSSVKTPADKLELLLYLDEIAPINTGIWEGFKGLF